MSNPFSMADLLEFLDHAATRGLLPTATARSLQVATRSVLGILTPQEQEDVGALDIAGVVKRFHNKRARDFSPGSLKEYGRRLHRTLSLYAAWRNDPSNFTAKARTTAASAGRRKSPIGRPGAEQEKEPAPINASGESPDTGEYATPGVTGYRTAFPVRPGIVVAVSNVPPDLTKGEADRLAEFIRLLAVE